MSLAGDYEAGGSWGDAIHFLDKGTFDLNNPIRIVGWKTPMVKDGQTMVAEFENSYVKFEIKDVKPCRNPRDMFFADAIAIEQKMKEPS